MKKSKIVGVQFGLMSPDEIRRLSVVEVKCSTVYDRLLPRADGVNDSRMGTVDRRVLCGTCNSDVTVCNGHVGSIEFPAPVYHVVYVDLVVKVLRCVCFWCSKLLSQPETDPKVQGIIKNLNGKLRFTALAACTRNRRTCSVCQGPQPSWTQNGVGIKCVWEPKARMDLMTGAVLLGGQKNLDEATEAGALDVPLESRELQDSLLRKYLSPAAMERLIQELRRTEKPFTSPIAYDILRDVSDSDTEIMGMNPKQARLESLMIPVLSVPPPIIRPSISVTEGSRARGQDDLTQKLQDIVKTSNALREQMELDECPATDLNKACRDKLDLLQGHIAAYINSDVRTQKSSGQRSSGPLRSICRRLKGKDGRIRGNLMGKRVDFSARSVISPDPNLDLDELGVPEQIALTLTVPEIVNSINLTELTKRVRVGPGKLNGAKSIIPDDGNLILLENCEHRDRIRLQNGWKVERYMRNGDQVIFNRQPSLHKMSMMSLRVRIMPGATFRLSVCAVTPFNADFDGDEMNMHLIQNTEAQTDVSMLMRLPIHIVSPQSNKPVIGLIQDALLGCFLLSHPGTFLRKDQMMQLTMCVHYPVKRIIPVQPGTVFMNRSWLWTGKQALSMLFPADLNMERSGDSDDHGTLTIRNGQLLNGLLNKSILGTTPGGLIHVLYLDHGADVAARFVSDAQRVANLWLSWRGFSVGLGDCVISSKVQDQVDALVSKALSDVTKLQAEGFASRMNRSALEPAVMMGLGRIMTTAGQFAQASMDYRNSIYCMVMGGSKGGPANIAQITSCVGQQSVDGKRIRSAGGRSLSCFSRDDIGPAACGFVRHSYMSGLPPDEFFFHKMGGREGLVDTSVKTAKTGYMQRRLMKGMESLKVEYDTTVRNSCKQIVEFRYGGDGMDGAKIEKVRLNFIRESNRTIQNRCTEQEADRLIQFRDVVRAIRTSLLTKVLSEDAWLPVNLSRMFITAINKYPVQPKYLESDLEDLVRVLMGRVERLLSLDGSLVLLAYLSSELTVKNLSKLGQEGIDWLFCEMQKKIETSLVEPGEMVGPLAAESCGEPATQLTLNTFHSAGTVHNVNLGVPRFNELIDMAKKIKTPMMTLRLVPQFRNNKEAVEKLRNGLAMTYLSSLVKSCTVIHEPVASAGSGLSEVPDRDIIELHGLVETVPETGSEFVMRFVLNEYVMMVRNMAPVDIARAVYEFLGDRVYVQWSETNMADWILRVRLVNVQDLKNDISSDPYHKTEADRSLNERIQLSLLNECSVTGMEGISSVHMHEVRVDVVNPETGEVETRTEYGLQTSGSNIETAMKLDFVDFSGVWTNDVQEVCNVLGIEAAVYVLFHEIKHVLCFDGGHLDDRHPNLVVNTMSHHGFMRPLNRHGINRATGTGPLVRSSFEETVEVLSDASAFGECDSMSGVSEAVMTGQIASIGSGMITLLNPRPPKRTDSEAPRVVTTCVTEECLDSDWGNSDNEMQNVPEDGELELNPDWDESLPSVKRHMSSHVNEGYPWSSCTGTSASHYDPSQPLMDLHSMGTVGRNVFHLESFGSVGVSDTAASNDISTTCDVVPSIEDRGVLPYRPMSPDPLL